MNGKAAKPTQHMRVPKLGVQQANYTEQPRNESHAEVLTTFMELGAVDF